MVATGTYEGKKVFTVTRLAPWLWETSFYCCLNLVKKFNAEKKKSAEAQRFDPVFFVRVKFIPIILEVFNAKKQRAQRRKGMKTYFLPQIKKKY